MLCTTGTWYFLSVSYVLIKICFQYQLISTMYLINIASTRSINIHDILMQFHVHKYASTYVSKKCLFIFLSTLHFILSSIYMHTCIRTHVSYIYTYMYVYLSNIANIALNVFQCNTGCAEILWYQRDRSRSAAVFHIYSYQVYHEESYYGQSRSRGVKALRLPLLLICMYSCYDLQRSFDHRNVERDFAVGSRDILG